MNTTFELQLWSEDLSSDLPVGQEVTVQVTKKVLDASFDHEFGIEEAEEIEWVIDTNNIDPSIEVDGSVFDKLNNSLTYYGFGLDKVE